MARPAGVTAKTKDNSRKLHRNREEWQKGKRIGRPKQVWVLDGRVRANGKDIYVPRKVSA